MRIKFFVDDILQEERVEEGFLVKAKTVGMGSVAIVDIPEVIAPFVDQEFAVPDGKKFSVQISKAEIFEEACGIMRNFPNLKVLEIRYKNAKIEIENTV